MDTLTADRLAAVLQEPKKSLLARVLRTLGQERCAAILADTLTIESNGGMLTSAGDRRRSPGGDLPATGTTDSAAGRERVPALSVPMPAKQPQQAAPGRHGAERWHPLLLTLDLWKGLTPMPVTAILKLVLRDLPETRERDGMVYMALQNEPQWPPERHQPGQRPALPHRAREAVEARPVPRPSRYAPAARPRCSLSRRMCRPKKGHWWVW